MGCLALSPRRLIFQGWSLQNKLSLQCALMGFAFSQAYPFTHNSFPSTVAAHPLTNIMAIFPSLEISPKCLLRKLFVWCHWHVNRNSSGFSAAVNTESWRKFERSWQGHSTFQVPLLNTKWKTEGFRVIIKKFWTQSLIQVRIWRGQINHVL